MPPCYELPPPEGLEEYVRCIRIEEPDAQEGRAARMLPCGCPELVIRASESGPRCVLHGQVSRVRMDLRDPGSPAGVTPVQGPGQAQGSGAGVTPVPGSSPGRTGQAQGSEAGGAVTFRFLPDGAAALLGLRMDTMTDRRTSMAELFGRAGRQLEERAALWRTMEERVDAGTEFLLARENRSAPDPLVRELVHEIEASRGQVALAALKRRFAISARQVERRFMLAVGLTPKLFARILRLRWFAEQAERCAGRTLAEIAREAGYFDQAHLNHDFKAMVGCSPRGYFGVVV